MQISKKETKNLKKREKEVKYTTLGYSLFRPSASNAPSITPNVPSIGQAGLIFGKTGR